MKNIPASFERNASKHPGRTMAVSSHALPQCEKRNGSTDQACLTPPEQLAATAFRLRVLIDFLERSPKRGDRISGDEKVVLRTFETVFGQVWWAPTNDEAKMQNKQAIIRVKNFARKDRVSLPGNAFFFPLSSHLASEVDCLLILRTFRHRGGGVQETIAARHHPP
ncbi:uncharacterized protein ARB_04109 [Trichophyton benhamiae CBS 112371]|uniref:Uncharacterized protein n=1 Tax=Arthroderma benhamiae (strain ATCC MYA-4681 / CBS 112371) TaxID=663331 RepID=D4AIL4_ARTBC|nr:uncharacterized protein ARB_04109 [Trichophyton benhamiae CBS 112371]EFE36587.1 hypothetical protein ARB_04109 [Trichophyton benhamiae CBS 112371]